MRSFAELLGENEAVDLLQQTLEEEKETDEKLTQLSKDVNNPALNASQATEETGEQEEETSRSTQSQRGRRTGRARSARA